MCILSLHHRPATLKVDYTMASVMFRGFIYLCAQAIYALPGQREVDIHGVELRLGHGVTFSSVNDIVNSKDLETYSFLVPKFDIPTKLFINCLPCIYGG